MRFLAERVHARRADPQRPVRLWLAAGWAGLLLLPWYAAPETSWLQLAAGLYSDAQAGNGLMQALLFGRV
jgi:iron(III) transport system permease protein